MSPSACREFVLKLVCERKPVSVNSLYASARKAFELRANIEMAAEQQPGADVPRPGLRPHASQQSALVRDKDLTYTTRCDAHAILQFQLPRATQVPPTTPRPRGSKNYDQYKDPDLVLPMDLKSYDPHKLRKVPAFFHLYLPKSCLSVFREGHGA
eukprot:6196039-Pleurochrysis_carterae.AAC.4